MANANDRGTIKWTSLMLPEHVELLREMWKEDQTIRKPLLDPQEIELLNIELQEALQNQTVIDLTIYTNNKITKHTGIISGMDKYNQSVTLTKSDERKINIPFNNILSVTCS